MSDQDTEHYSPREPHEPNDRLRSANEQLTLKALLSEEQAEESERRYTDQYETNKLLVQKQRLLQSLASELTLTEQRERKRLSTDLHDFLAQILVLGRMRIGQARSRFAEADPSLLKVFNDLDDLFTKSLAFTRTLMAELCPPALHELGLVAALESLGKHIGTLGVQVAVDLAPSHVPLSEEQRVLLYQSVRELLINVVKHAKTSEATLSLSVEANETLHINVHDAGAGFDPGEQAHHTSEHFGLLSIQERMEAMGGWLHIQSAPTQGTTITLGLPLTHSLNVESIQVANTMCTAPCVTRTHATSRMIRVLLVDDHPMVRQGLRMILGGYDDVIVVVEASNGLEAVSAAADLTPDVILMDINMPVMDGIEATRQIKSMQPSTIVVGLSFNLSSPVQEAVIRAGASIFLSKEVAGEQLHQTLAALARLT